MTSADRSTSKAPLSDAIIIALSKLVDDAQSETREPSHSDIEFQIEKVQLQQGDPKNRGQLVGKAKRVRGVLNWAIDNNYAAGQEFVANLISLVKGCGGFRETSPNYVGEDAISDFDAALRSESYELTRDGELRSLILENLSGVGLTSALEAYVRRAKRGAVDAALVTGTSKDLLEATAAHVLVELWGTYSSGFNFPTLLGQAFTALGLATPQEAAKDNEPVQRHVERSMYEIACAINRLRNKEGAGHGRPWLSTVNDDEARFAVELMGAISERLLSELKRKKI